MRGLGTIINVAAIILGGLIGMLCGGFMKESMKTSLMKSCGISVLFMSIASAMSKMLEVSDQVLTSTGTMLIIGSLALGTVIGEWLDIDGKMERFGQWLKQKTGNGKDNRFVDAFVTASLTVCVGAMAVVGSIEDGLTGDYSILLAKAVLDFIIVLVMASSLGKGSLFSFLPVGLFQGSITLLAVFLKGLITDLALNYLSLVGALLIFCVGLNLTFENSKIKVGNMLPSLLVAVIWAYL